MININTNQEKECTLITLFLKIGFQIHEALSRKRIQQFVFDLAVKPLEFPSLKAFESLTPAGLSLLKLILKFLELICASLSQGIQYLTTVIKGEARLQ